MDGLNKSIIKYLIDTQLSEIENIKKIMVFRGFDPTFSDKYESILDLEPYFQKDSVVNYEVTHPIPTSSIHKWVKSFASNRMQGNYISPEVLEPFIARYILAINSIGIKTFFSCDGWHKKRGNNLLVGFADRNSKVWHKIIFENIQQETHFDIHWIYSGNFGVLELPDTDLKRINVYKILNNVAEYIELRKNEFLELKIRVINKLKNKKKNMLTDEELYMLLTNTLRNEN